jgi:hypothetical protein
MLLVQQFRIAKLLEPVHGENEKQEHAKHMFSKGHCEKHGNSLSKSLKRKKSLPV